MNELIKIERQEVAGMLSNDEAMRMFGVFAVLMNQISQIAYTDLDLARNAMREIQAPPGLEYLKDAVLTHLFWAVHCKRTRETHIQAWFFENIDTLVPGSKRAKVAIDPNHIPDGFLEINGETVPVEVKLEAFTSSSLSQLKRYMKVYRARHGIAVAKELRCDLPSSVTFIKASDEELAR